MKKSLIIATVSAVTILSSIVYASDIDLKSMSDEEIIQLYSDVEHELVDRNINKSSELLPGIYVGGVDIPVGGYTVNAPANDEAYYIDVTGENNKGKYYSFSEITLGNEDGNYHFNIKDGETLSVSGRTATITINNGLNFE